MSLRASSCLVAAGLLVAAAALGPMVRAAPKPALREGARLIPRWPRVRLPLASAAQARRAMRAGVELLNPVGVPVPGVLALRGTHLDFEPARPLAGCSVYTLLLRAEGHGPLRIRLRTGCSRWSPPLQIDQHAHARQPQYAAGDVHLAATARGGVVAVWSQGDGRRSAVFSSRRLADTGSWTPPRRLGRNAPGSDELPAVATLGTGQVLAAWVHVRRASAMLLAQCLGNGCVPQRLDRAGLRRGPASVRLAADAEGDAVAVWEQPWQGHGAIWAAHWSAARHRWSPARLLAAGRRGSYAPVVAGAGDDRFAVAWERGPVGHESVRARRWRRGRWSAPHRLSAHDVRAQQPRLALDARGDLAAAWVQGRGAAQRVAVRRMVWPHWTGSSFVLRAHALHAAAADPALAFDAAGNLALAWEQQRARLRPFRIEAARWPRAAQLPGSVQRLDQPDGRGAGHPVLVADPAGNLLCAWYQLGAQGLQVWMARFDASSLHWQAAQRLSQPRQTVRASLPALSVDTAGSVTAAWQQYNNWRNIIVARRLP